MSSLLPTFPLPKLLSGAGGAGPRRIVIIGGLAAGVLCLVAIVAIAGHHTALPPKVGKIPNVDPLPGGAHSTPFYEDLAKGHAQDQAKRAEEVGKSSVAPMPGSIAAEPVPAQPMVLPAPTVAAPHPVIVNPAPAVRPKTRSAEHPVAVRNDVGRGEEVKLDKDQTAAYEAAIRQLLAGWSGKPPSTEILLDPKDADAASGATPSRAATAGIQEVSASQSPAADVSMAKRRPKRVLMPGKRGVYGRTVIGGNSDSGGPIVVEAESGPINGLRMSGTFERRDERLVVHLNSITLADGHDEKIDALLVAQDTLETAVASSVEEHYVARFLLPAAAAFISGLGQAIQQSDSTVQSSPFGTVTAYNKLNLGKEFAVGAGAAATQIGTTLAQSAPKGPTVNLGANADVGIFFLAPLEVSE